MEQTRYTYLEGVFTVSVKFMPSTGRATIGDLCAIGRDGIERQFVVQACCGPKFPKISEGRPIWMRSKYSRKEDYWLVEAFERM